MTTSTTVLVEELEPAVQVYCTQVVEGSTRMTINISDPSMYADAKVQWARDDLVYVVHEPSCGSLNERQFFRPVRQPIALDHDAFSLDGIWVEAGTESSSTSLRISHDPSPPKGAILRYASLLSDDAKRTGEIPKGEIGKRDNPFKWHHHSIACQWHPQWDEREKIVNLDNVFSPGSKLGLDCLNCSAGVDLELTWNIHIDLMGVFKSGDDLRKRFMEASVELKSPTTTHLRTEIELHSSLGIDYWCNWSPEPICGVTYAAGGQAFQPANGIKPPLESKFQHNDGTKDKNKPHSFGPLKFSADRIGVGIWTDFSLTGEVLLLFPAISLVIPGGSNLKIDLMSNNMIDGSNFNPQIDVGIPSFEVHNVTLQGSIAAKLSAGFHVGHSLVYPAVDIGGRLDLARLNLKLAEEIGQTEHKMRLSLTWSQGFIRWLNIAKLFLNTGQLPFPLYLTFPIFDVRFPCPDNTCLSDLENKLWQKLSELIFGDLLGMSKHLDNFDRTKSLDMKDGSKSFDAVLKSEESLSKNAGKSDEEKEKEKKKEEKENDPECQGWEKLKHIHCWDWRK